MPSNRWSLVARSRIRRGREHGHGGDLGDHGELTGRVLRYERRKGFGFIKVKGRADVFVHISGSRARSPRR
ncbi:MAG: cold shock domain-containing protein [Microthrixaceae bacterium]|nr:cold shock domain-containing protein [Microthrixaceae bacterium]